MEELDEESLELCLKVLNNINDSKIIKKPTWIYVPKGLHAGVYKYIVKGSIKRIISKNGRMNARLRRKYRFI